MRKVRILLGLGVWVAVLPHLGFPYVWKNILFLISGLGIIYVGFVLYRELDRGNKSDTFDNFLENSDFTG